jgi:hypothetical protein
VTSTVYPSLKKPRRHCMAPGSFRYTIDTVGSGKSTSRSTKSERIYDPFGHYELNRVPLNCLIAQPVFRG